MLVDYAVGSKLWAGGAFHSQFLKKNVFVGN